MPFQGPAQVLHIPGLLALEIASHKGAHPPAFDFHRLRKAKGRPPGGPGKGAYPVPPQVGVFQIELPALERLCAGDGELGGEALPGVLHKRPGAPFLHPAQIRTPSGVPQIGDHLPHILRPPGQRGFYDGCDHAVPPSSPAVLHPSYHKTGGSASSSGIFSLKKPLLIVAYSTNLCYATSIEKMLEMSRRCWTGNYCGGEHP